ncbi:hypothetical protein EYF80_045812 [Liparis tanakae]|uniref:Uncharacterized protein n=1 Tax=Liparis tanakae TaxID=230148 RepID=A0A4Z2FTF6_9TELE|nr:hypothetical protein EYF80_045812 [Liparis tanakae]
MHHLSRRSPGCESGPPNGFNATQETGFRALHRKPGRTVDRDFPVFLGVFHLPIVLIHPLFRKAFFNLLNFSACRNIVITTRDFWLEV